MASFEELKSKYQSVLAVVQREQVQMANLHLQDGKLLMKGTAPSLEAANKVWDAIKRINPQMDDITADFPVDPNIARHTQPSGQTGAGPAGQSRQPGPSQPGPSRQTAHSGPSGQIYKVQAGDTLSKISKQFYGNPDEYMKIFEANRDKLKDPNKIQPGQELKIPPAA